MRNKLLTLFFLLLMLTLIVAIIVIGLFIYSDFVGNESTEVVYSIESISTEDSEDVPKKQNPQTQMETNISEKIEQANSKKEEKVSKNTNNNNISSFYYNQLTDEQKNIYQGLQTNKDNLKFGNYVIEYGDIFPNSQTEEEGQKKLGDDYQTAIEAFTHDNSDLFYLDVNKMYLNIETTTKFFKTTHKIYISAASGATYLSNEFTSTEQIEEINRKIIQVKDDVLKSLNGTDYQNIGYIHDYIVNNAEYDNEYNAIGSYSIYGALIGKKCVCEGYMKAFKFLANAAGYECEMLQGVATNSSGKSENHAWNCIKINGKWYQIDLTWDDPIIIGNGKLSNEARYRYFLKGTSTFEKDHVLSYQFSENGKIFKYPDLCEHDY